MENRGVAINNKLNGLFYVYKIDSNDKINKKKHRERRQGNAQCQDDTYRVSPSVSTTLLL